VLRRLPTVKRSAHEHPAVPAINRDHLMVGYAGEEGIDRSREPVGDGFGDAHHVAGMLERLRVTCRSAVALAGGSHIRERGTARG
jgi:hypothetical protein